MKKQIINLNALDAFRISARYNDVALGAPKENPDSHIHDECEIYINLSGDVSFMVENRIYPILPGNIIITRPYEYHHCIYHSNKLHRHYWILFSSKGNEEILDIFFKRKAGEHNLLVLPVYNTEELISLCDRLCDNNENNQIENYCIFFDILKLLKKADKPTPVLETHPDDITFSLDYINKNLSESFTVKELAQKANVSLNTLERHFLKALNTSPRNYIKKKRLANILRLLSLGDTVTDACSKSGISDYSGFIKEFKSIYGITPLKYQKQIQNK